VNESGHTQAINKKVKAAGVYALKIQTLMNNGVPDCWYSGKKQDIWVEYKYIKLPVKFDTPIKPTLSFLQMSWLYARHGEGRNVYVIIGSDKGWLILDNPLLWNSPMFKNIFESSRTRNDIAEWIIHKTTV
jgi:hypothetical protein